MPYRWLSARLQYLHCVSNGDTAVLHKAIDINISPKTKRLTFVLSSEHAWLVDSLNWIGRNAHDGVIKCNHFPRYWPFVRGIHRSPVDSPNKGQWRGALMFSLICAWINGWVNNREAGNLRCPRSHYDVIVMSYGFLWIISPYALWRNVLETRP